MERSYFRFTSSSSIYFPPLLPHPTGPYLLLRSTTIRRLFCLLFHSLAAQNAKTIMGNASRIWNILWNLAATFETEIKATILSCSFLSKDSCIFFLYVCVCVCVYDCTLIEVFLTCSFSYYRHIMSWCVGGVRLSSLAREPKRHDSLSSQLCDF